jgi:Icc-related predicted phosphoesterase
MRILASADLHGLMAVYEWLLQAAVDHRADLWILAGDLFAGDFPQGQRLQASRIMALLRRSPVPVFYLMGNDDNVLLEGDDDRIRLLHGRRLEMGEYNFVGYHYTPPFVGDLFVKEEPEIAKDLAELSPLITTATVVVTHAPAHGILDQVHGRPVGSPAIADLLARRHFLAHIHGHIHEGFGRSGRHFNVAAAGVRRAMLIDLPDLECQILRG